MALCLPAKTLIPSALPGYQWLVMACANTLTSPQLTTSRKSLNIPRFFTTAEKKRA
jgi:hypothetical protein